jgi:SAM-dependent methyltransferase
MPNTTRSFYDKWHENPDLAFRATLTPGSDIQTWILTRNGWQTPEGLTVYLRERRRILDAGCGNGRVTALLAQHAPESAEIVGADLTAADVARRNLIGAPNVTVHQADLLADLDFLGDFDFIYCQEVLHHTGDPARAFANVAARLRPGGEYAIYVYRRKAPVREFTDDHVRAAIADLPYEEAMDVSRAIAEIGRQLSASGAEITVPDIPQIGIDGGTYDVQRFVYHFFMKCFWSDELDAEANAAINYDWYHPQDCSRHTLNEVRGWFAASDLAVVHEHVDPYGITVRGRRPGPGAALPQA